MPIRRLLAPTAAALALGVAAADAAPRVVADIAPTHAIVARVMEGVGAPTLLIPPGTSPHGYALRPSEAEALQSADLVVWVGEALTPWLAEPLSALAGDATSLALIDAAPLVLLAPREGGDFAAHVHADAEHADGHAEDRHGHDEEQHGHADAEHADGHAEDGHGHDEEPHGEAAADPHVWLDPVNAGIMAGTVAEALTAADPANADAYRANAAGFAAELEALTAAIEARLAPVRGGRFVVFHDAYQYFEARFDLPATGSVALSDAERPSAARVREIRDRVRAAGVACIFAEPQFEPALIGTVIEGTEVRSATLDPVGAGLEPGPALYPRLLGDLADGLAGCLGGGS